MLSARIQVNGLGYHGESLAETYEADTGGDGWHVANHHKASCLILKEDEGREMAGLRNIQSHIIKICHAIKFNQIEGREITITFSEPQGAQE